MKTVKITKVNNPVASMPFNRKVGDVVSTFVVRVGIKSFTYSEIVSEVKEDSFTVIKKVEGLSIFDKIKSATIGIFKDLRGASLDDIIVDISNMDKAETKNEAGCILAILKVLGIKDVKGMKRDWYSQSPKEKGVNIFHAETFLNKIHFHRVGLAS